MGGFLPGNGLPTDQGAEPSPVTTPDQKALGKSRGQGLKESGIVGHLWAVLFCALISGLEVVINTLVGAFDEVLSLFVGLVTAAQATKTQGFYDLTAAIINDLLGVEVAGAEIAKAGAEHGLIAAMQAAGGDFFNLLMNEFLGRESTASRGIGTYSGMAGEAFKPGQGVSAAQAFIGFMLSFAVRQGNLETIATAMPENIRMFDGIRAYGELMAKNLGLGRLSRRALQPLIQTLITDPLQQDLNVQFRPHMLDAKQLATAYLRGGIDLSDYKARLARLGYTDGDATLQVSDTLTRLPLESVYLLHENNFLTDTDFLDRVRALGFVAEDFGLLIQAKNLEQVQRADRSYIETAMHDLREGLIDLSTFNSDVDATSLPKVEKDALKRNGGNRVAGAHRHLSLGFLKRAYLDAVITLQELLDHLAALGYSQDDIDIVEVEVLTEQKKAADKVKALAVKRAAKTAAKATKLPPQAGG